MTFPEFDKFQQELLKEVVGMRDTKGKEYAHSEDRFANFNRLAAGLNLPNYLIGWVYCKKHLDSIESFMKDGKVYSNEAIQSRFLDAITYLILIAGMVREFELSKLQFRKATNIGEPVGKHCTICGLPWSQRPTEVGGAPYCNTPSQIHLWKGIELEDKNTGKHQPFEFDPTSTKYYCPVCGKIIESNHVCNLINQS